MAQESQVFVYKLNRKRTESGALENREKGGKWSRKAEVIAYG